HHLRLSFQDPIIVQHVHNLSDIVSPKPGPNAGKKLLGLLQGLAWWESESARRGGIRVLFEYHVAVVQGRLIDRIDNISVNLGKWGIPALYDYLQAAMLFLK